MSRRKPKLFEVAARAKSPVLASGKAPRSAIAKAERAVVAAAEEWVRLPGERASVAMVYAVKALGAARRGR